MMTKIEIDPVLLVRDSTALIQGPIVVRVNAFDESSLEPFTKSFQSAMSFNQPVIPVVIDSYGGQVYTLLAMIDVMKSADRPVMTVVEGKAMSCGAVLFACGTEGHRFMGPCATLMVHDISDSVCGKNEEIKASAKEAERLNALLYKIMAESVGKHATYFWDIVQSMGRADWYLSATEAKQHNLCNHVRIPALKTSVVVRSIVE